MSKQFHPTSIIHKGCKIEDNVSVGPYSIIGPNVKIGKNTKIHSHVIIVGNTTIGANNEIYPFSAIGSNPQHLKYDGEMTELTIGKNNIFREHVTIHPGTNIGIKKTTIGDNGFFMVGSHVAHDCIVGNNVILANNVPLGGHAEIDDNVIIGGNSAVQQFTRVGRSAMIGGMCGVVRDIIPYGIAHGNRSILQGLNLIGLRRKNIPNKEIMTLSNAYKEIFKNENLTDNLNSLSKDFKKSDLVMEVVNFLEKDKKRPICTPFSK